MFRLSLSIAASLILVIGCPAAKNPWDTGHWRYPNPTGNQLASVAWGEDRFVAAGEMGTVLVCFRSCSGPAHGPPSAPPSTTSSTNATAAAKLSRMKAHRLVL
jgi:hypothetical protein